MKNQHAYQKIEQDLKSGDMKNVALLYGKEQYLVKWSAEAILKKYTSGECREFDFFEIDPEKTTVARIVESCETLSMLSEKRVVYLPDFALLSGGKLKNIPEADEKQLAGYIKEVPDTCVLIITAETIDKRKKLYKEIASHGSAYDFGPLDERGLKSFISKRFALLEKTIKPSVLDELIKRSGYFHKETDCTLYNLVNEVKKIAAHSGGDEILLADALEVISGDIETNIFAMIDAASRDKKDEAFRLLYNLLGSGGNVFQALSLLASQFETILEVKEMRGEGKTLGEIQRISGIHEFRIKMAAPVADAYSVYRLKDILSKVYQVEKNIKTGLMDQVLAFEVMLSEI